MSKEEIRKMGLSLGADVVGFAAVEDYKSKRAPDLKTLFPGIRSMVVVGFREINGSLASDTGRISMHSRIGMMDLTRKCTYHMAKALEDKYRVKAAPIMPSYPLNMAAPYMGLVADVSLRHAAVAAGLGTFGRHNLVISPRFGTRIIFTAVLTDMEFKSDPPVTDALCDDCNLCVESCPARALDLPGRTEDLKCLRNSQPFGIGSAIGFIRKFMASTPEQQKAMIMDPQFLSLYQASFIGFQYECFKCMAVCPACIDA
jgi:epoxyqueuosine reductase QueG